MRINEDGDAFIRNSITTNDIIIDGFIYDKLGNNLLKMLNNDFSNQFREIYTNKFYLNSCNMVISPSGDDGLKVISDQRDKFEYMNYNIFTVYDTDTINTYNVFNIQKGGKITVNREEDARYDVDIFGTTYSTQFVSEVNYTCNLIVWGSNATILTPTHIYNSVLIENSCNLPSLQIVNKGDSNVFEVYHHTVDEENICIMVSNDGMVGINMMSPEYDLDVHGNAHVSDLLVASNMIIYGDNATIFTPLLNSNFVHITNETEYPSLKINNYGISNAFDVFNEDDVALVVAKTGTLGINIYEPDSQYKLDVNGNIHTNSLMSANNLLVYGQYANIKTTTLIENSVEITNLTDAFSFKINNNGFGNVMEVNDNGSPALTIPKNISGTPLNNVGINTSEPQYNLEVVGDTHVTSLFKTSNFLVYGDDATILTRQTNMNSTQVTNESEYPAVKINNYGISNAFEVFDDERAGLIVAKGGFVGINTYNPEYDLEIIGNTHTSSLLKTSNFLVYGDDATILTRQTNFNSTQVTNESAYPAVKINNYGISNAFEVFDDERAGLIIAKGGFVGINTYNPEYDLEIIGNTHTSSLLKTSNFLVYGDDATILTRQTNMNSTQVTNESEYPAVKINNYGISNAFEVFDDERAGLIVAKGGFVGINTYEPEYDLEIIGNTHTSSLLKTSNFLVYGDDTTILTRQTNMNSTQVTNESEYPAVKINNYGISNAFEVFDDDRAGLIVAKGGFVGINTYEPEYDLEVYGDTNVTSLLKTSNFLVYGDDTTILTRQTNMNSTQVTNESEYPAVKINNYGISNAFEVFDDERAGLIVAKGGFVGINTYEPEYDLEIIGNTHTSSLLKTSNFLVYGDDATILTRQTNMNSTQVTNESEYPAVKINNYGISNAFEVFDDERAGLIVAKGGFVGINTYNPEYDLEVYGDGHITSLLKTSNFLVYGDDATILTRQTNFNSTQVTNESEYPAVKINNYGISNAFEVFDDERAGLIVAKGGFVGINTYEPEYDLEVYGDAHVTSLFKTSNLLVYGDDTTILTKQTNENVVKIISDKDDTAFSIYNNGDGDAVHIENPNGYNFTITNQGFIGINRIDPDYEVDIVGNLRVSETLYTSNIVIYGDTTTINTTTYQSEKMEIVSQTEGPALTVKQYGADDMFRVYDDDDIVFTINNTRKVGVNKIDPEYDLDINGEIHTNTLTKTYNLEVYGDEAVIQTRMINNNFIQVINQSEYPAVKIENTGASNAFEVFDDGVEALVVAKGGTVGINIYEPDSQYRLDVNGTVHVNDQLKTFNLEIYGDEAVINSKVYVYNNLLIAQDTEYPAARIENTGTSNAFEVYDDDRACLIITKGGYIGINTDAPEYDLEIIGQAHVDTLLRAYSIEVYGSELKILTPTISSNYVDITNDTDTPSLKINNYGTANALEVYDDEILSLIVSKGGNVGINTDSPGYKLEVSGNAHVSDQLMSKDLLVYGDETKFLTRLIQSNYVNIINDTDMPTLMVANYGTSNALEIYNDENINLIITKDGLIGINTYEPSYDFDVNGTINATYLQGDGQYIFNVNLEDRTTSLLREGSNLYYTPFRVGVITAASNVHASNYVFTKTQSMDRNFSNAINVTINDRFNYIQGLASADSTALYNTIEMTQTLLSTNTSNLYLSTIVDDIFYNSTDSSNYTTNVYNILTNEMDILTNFVDNISLQTGTGNIVANYEFVPVIRYDFNSATSNLAKLVDIGDGGSIRFDSYIYNSSNVAANNRLTSVQGFAGKAFLWKYVQNTNVSPYIYNTNTANLRLLMNSFHMCNGFSIHFVIRKTIQNTINQIFMIVNGATYNNTFIKVTVEESFLIFYVGNTYFASCQIDDDVWYNVDCICKISSDYSTMSLFIYINGDYSKSTNTVNVPYNNDLLNPSLTNLVLLIGYNLNNTFYDNNNAELYLENLQLFSKAITLEEMDGLLYNFDTWKISSGFAPVSSNVYYPYGNVGIGTNNPKNELHIAGNATVEIGDIYKKTQVYIPESINPDVWYRFTEIPTSAPKVLDYGYSNLALTINNGSTTTKATGYTGNSYLYQNAYTWNSSTFYLSNADTSNIVTMVDKFNNNGFTIHFVMKISSLNKDYPIFFVGKNTENLIYIKVGTDNRLHFISTDIELTSDLLAANIWLVVDVLFEIYGAIASVTININGSTTNTVFDFVSKFDIYKVIKQDGTQTWITSLGAYDNRFDNLEINGIQYYIGKHPTEAVNASGLTLQDFRIYNEPLITTEINKLFYGRADVSKIKTTVTEPYGVERWISSTGYYDTSGKYITYNGGNVGIGTNEPVAGLHVMAESNYMCLLVDNFGTSNSLEVFDDNNPTFIVAKGGNVGIGLYTPTQALQIQRPYTNNYMKIDSGSTHCGIMLTQFNVNLGYSIRYDVSTDKMLFSTQNNALTYTNLMALTNVGRLGIGSTIPQYTMDVYGSTDFDGSTILRLYNPASSFGRTQLIMVGRYETNNDAWNLTSGRNAMIFGSQTVKDGTISYTNAIQAYNGNLGLFSSAYSSSVPALTLTSGGNVGIGSTTPNTKLEVLGSGNNSSFNSSLSTYSSYMGFKNTADSKASYIGLDGIGFADIERGALLMGTWTANSVIFNTNGSEKVRITSAGNVGIGTNNPTCKLDIIHTVGSTNSPFLRLGNTAGGAGNQVGIIMSPYSARTGGAATQIWAIDDGGSSAHLAFGTAATGATTTLAERMRILTSGNVGIGTATPGYLLDVNGTFRNVGGSIITVQGAQDGGTGRGIYFWLSTNTDWGMYMGQAGVSKSLSGGTAVAGSGITSYAIRTRAANSATSGFIWENNSEVCLASLRASDGLMYIAGNTGIGNSTNIVSKLTINPVVIDRGTYDHSEAPLTITNQTATSSTILNDPKSLLHLCRQGTASQSYGAKASLKICRWEHTANYDSRTRLDFTLSHGQYDDINIVSIRSDGSVGIGTTSPTDELHIHKSATTQYVGIRLTDATTGATSTDGSLFEKDNSSHLRLWNFESADMYFGTANTEKLRILSGGSVGIGTNNPVSFLDVMNATPTLTLRTSGNGSGRINFGNSTHGIGRNVSLSTLTGGNDVVLFTGGDGNLGFVTGSTQTERMRINTSGYVGIGLTNPSTNLHVSSALAAAANSFPLRISAKTYIDNNGTGTFIGLGTEDATWSKCGLGHVRTGPYDIGDIVFLTRSTQDNVACDMTNERIRIKSFGNVGIGSTNPTEKLDVTGNIKVSGNINSVTSTELSYLSGVTSSIQTQINNSNIYTSNYVVGTSNIISNRITALTADNIANGSTNKFIINNAYNNDLTVNGTLTATNLNVNGTTTMINTTTYQTENMEIVTSAVDGPALKIVQNGTQNLLDVMDATVNVFCIKDGGNVGINNTSPSERLDITGNIKVSGNFNNVTSTELGYLSGVTSSIQTQINSKEPTIALGSTQYALINTSGGKVGVSAVTSTELGYVSGVTSSIQTQINSKEPTIALGSTQYALVNTAGGKVGVSTVTSTELGYVSGVTSSIQTQINSKEPTIALGSTQYALINTAGGKVGVSAVTSTELGYVSGVTSSIQTQINSKQNTLTAGTGITISGNTISSVPTQWTTSGTAIYYNSGAVGIGTNTIGTSLLLDVNHGGLNVAGTQFTSSGNDATISLKNTGPSGRTWWLGSGSSSSGAGNNFYIFDSTGSASRFVINSSGNTGIGTTNPKAALELYSISNTIPAMIISGKDANSNTSTDGIAVFCNNNVANNRQLCFADSTKLTRNTTNVMLRCIPDANWIGGSIINSVTTDDVTNKNLLLNYNLMILGSGNVGIGTTVPLEELHMHNNTAAQQVALQLTDGTTSAAASRGVIIAKTTNQDLSIINYQSGKDIIMSTSPTTTGTISERLRLLANGNLGIGVANPGYKLDVSGDINITGTFRVNGSAFATSQWTTTDNNIYYTTGNVGIGTNSPNAPLQFANVASYRKIVLYEVANNDHQILGLGANGGLTFQNPNTSDAFQWRAGTSTTTSSELMRLTGAGNLGIGVTNPGNILQVGNGGKLRISNGTSDYSLIGSKETDDSSNTRVVISGIDRGGASAGGNIEYVATASGNHIWFSGGSTERMRMNSSGNLGIGTNSPASKLHIYNSSTNINADNSGGVSLYVFNPTNAANNNSIICNRIGGTSANKVIYSIDVSNGYGWSMYLQGNDTTNRLLRFNSSWDGGGTDRLVINGTNGNVGVGIANPAYALDVSGDINITGSFRVNGTAFTGGGSSQWTTSSTNIYYTTGSVGIGTNSPSATLTVWGQQASTSTGGAGTLALYYNGGWDNGVLGSSITFTQRWWNGNNVFVSVGMITGVKTQDNGNFGGGLTFWTGPAGQSTLAERMRIVDNGNVGIGTNGPAARLNVYEATGTTAGANSGSIILDHGNNGGASSITFRSAVNRGSDYAYIQYQDTSTVGGGGESAQLIIGTQNDPDDHILLMPSGNVGVGKTPAYKLDVQGDICARSGWLRTSTQTGLYNEDYACHFYPNEAQYGNWRIHSANTSYNGSWDGLRFTTAEVSLMAGNNGVKRCGFHYNGVGWALYVDENRNLNVPGDITAYYSDRRLKTNLIQLEHFDNVLSSLTGYTFNWNEKGQELLQKTSDEIDVGLIAQDVQKVLPQAVKINTAGAKIGEEGSYDYLTIKYDKLIPFLIEGYKHQKTVINEQSQEIQDLKSRLEKLEKLVEKLL